MSNLKQRKIYNGDYYPIIVTLIIGTVIAFLILNLTVLHYPSDYEIVAVLLMVPALFLVSIVRFIP